MTRAPRLMGYTPRHACTVCGAGDEERRRVLVNEPSVLLLAIGLALMVLWLAIAVVYRRFVLWSVVFASTPAFQLFWAGLGIDNRAVLAVPLVVVPLAAIATAVLVSMRWQREGRDRPDQLSASRRRVRSTRRTR